jgi:hypothetical protein
VLSRRDQKCRMRLRLIFISNNSARAVNSSRRLSENVNNTSILYYSSQDVVLGGARVVHRWQGRISNQGVWERKSPAGSRDGAQSGVCGFAPEHDVFSSIRTLNSNVKKTKLSKNHLVFIVRVVLKSKNDCAEKSEVSFNEMLQITAKRLEPLAIAHLQLIMQLNGIFEDKILNWMDLPLQRGTFIHKKPQHDRQGFQLYCKLQ